MEVNQRVRDGVVAGLASFYLVAGHVAAAESHLPEYQIGCYSPSTEDYAGVDAALYGPSLYQPTPEEVIDAMAGRDSGIKTELSMEARQRAQGVEVYGDEYQETFNDIIGEPTGDNFHELVESKKFELFGEFQRLTAAKFGMEVTMETETYTFDGQPLSGKAEQQVIRPAAVEDLSSSDLIQMYNNMGYLPASIFKATGEKEIKIYKDGGNVAGFVNGEQTIHLKTDSFDVIEHEQGHEINGMDCEPNMADTEFTALNRGMNVYGDNHEPTPNFDEYVDAHDDEASDRQNMNDDDYSNNIGYNQAVRKVDELHADEAQKMATMTGYRTSEGEDKAEFYKYIMGDKGARLSDMLSSGKPIIAAKTRLLLARMFHRDPVATTYFIKRGYTHDRHDLLHQLRGDR